MNLRTLKKLSKRAAPLLPMLGDTREQFAAERDENYMGLANFPRKHWERRRVAHGHPYRGISMPARDGNGFIHLHEPDHPRKGTVMVGSMSGYYGPEWSEETAWEALLLIVHTHFTDWDFDCPQPTRFFSCPTEYLAAAREIIAAREAGNA